MPAPDNRPILTRIAEKSISDWNSECIFWTGARSGRGYGVLRLRNPRRMEYVHVLVYKEHYGSVTAGCVVHHTCEVLYCVNPAHLEAVTQSWHMLQHKNGNTGNVCTNGHPRSVYGRRRRDGRVACRECERVGMQKYRKRKTAITRASESVVLAS